MDYSVGSLSDLITGTNTPNKRKVVQKQLTPSTTSSKETTKVKKSPKKKVLELPVDSSPEIPVKEKKGNKETSTLDISVVKKSKKRKLENTVIEESPPKKSKNDENAERRVRKKEKVQKLEENPEELAKTVFVGNLPIAIKKDKFKRFFMKYGKVDCVRIRGVPVANPKTPKKVAVIKQEFHPDRKSLFGYVRFENREDAEKAAEANGVLYKEHHLRIHLCDAKDKPDESRAVFVGNLSFKAEEEELWQLFEPCGEIISVRIVRDGRTGMGRGFGYVNFKTSDAVQLALELEDVKLNDRELRINSCNLGAAKKNKKNNQNKKISKPGKPRKYKIVSDSETKAESVSENTEKDGSVKVTAKGFQGVKFSEKKMKKNKLNKGALQKKKMIKKLTVKAK